MAAKSGTSSRACARSARMDIMRRDDSKERSVIRFSASTASAPAITTSRSRSISAGSSSRRTRGTRPRWSLWNTPWGEMAVAIINMALVLNPKIVHPTAARGRDARRGHRAGQTADQCVVPEHPGGPPRKTRPAGRFERRDSYGAAAAEKHLASAGNKTAIRIAEKGETNVALTFPHHEIFHQAKRFAKHMPRFMKKWDEIVSFIRACDPGDILFVACGSIYWMRPVRGAERSAGNLRSLRAIKSSDLLFDPECTVGVPTPADRCA